MLFLFFFQNSIIYTLNSLKQKEKKEEKNLLIMVIWIDEVLITKDRYDNKPFFGCYFEF